MIANRLVATLTVNLFLLPALFGCVDPSMLKSKPQEKASEEASDSAAPAEAGAPEGANPQAAAPSFPKDNTKLVDKNKMLAENPALIETENHINATDPLSAAGQGFFAIGSRAQVLNLKHAVDLYKAEHDKLPSFVEFEKMLSDNNVKLNGIYRWQVYAYDETTGDIVILEDREMKRQEYEKGGLTLDE